MVKYISPNYLFNLQAKFDNFFKRFFKKLTVRVCFQENVFLKNVNFHTIFSQ